MEKNIWKEISINSSSEALEIIYEFLEEQGLDGITIKKDDNNKNYNLKAYFLNNNFNNEDLVNHIKDIFSENKFKFQEIEINTIKDEDWENNWKEYFDVFKIGDNLVFKPSWQEYNSKKNDIVINFDSGAFFGSTPHPSTRLCLEEIEIISKEIKEKDNCNILDLGVGSGILSLALYSLGFKDITAIDIDPIAIRASEDNFNLNNMNIELFLGDLDSCHETYDIIAGNLLAETIIQLSSQISEKTNKNGIFIGAGINKNQEENVIKELEKVGFNINRTKYYDDWVLINAVKI